MINLGEYVFLSNIRVCCSHFPCCCNASFHPNFAKKTTKHAGSGWAVLMMFLFRAHLSEDNPAR